MDILFELIFEVVIEGAKDKKTPKALRYFLIFLVSLFYLAVFSLIFIAGVYVLKNSILSGVIVIALDILMIFLSILRFKKLYNEHIKK